LDAIVTDLLKKHNLQLRLDTTIYHKEPKQF